MICFYISHAMRVIHYLYVYFVYSLCPGEKMYATGVWFEEGEVSSTRWSKLEELLVMSNNGGTLPVMYRQSVQLYTNTTENKLSPTASVRGKSFLFASNIYPCKPMDFPGQLIPEYYVNELRSGSCVSQFGIYKNK